MGSVFASHATKFLMKSRIVGLRVASLILGCFALWHIARLWAGADLVIGRYHPGLVPRLISIAVAGVASIWLAKLAGPWSATMAEPNRRPE